jgi:hypothetical protein
VSAPSGSELIANFEDKTPEAEYSFKKKTLFSKHKLKFVNSNFEELTRFGFKQVVQFLEYLVYL